MSRFTVSVIMLLVYVSTSARAQYTLEPAFADLTFVRPVEVVTASDGTDRFFVVSQNGTIEVLPIAPDATPTVFLDIQNRLVSGGERGLLGLAFHPDYAQNGYFFVNYTRQQGNQLQTVVARYRVSGNDPDQADPASEQILLTVDQPFGNHNAGKLAFGPDGYLYASLGDGGSAGDPQNHGQNTNTLLGNLLRLDVDSVTTAQPYRVPADNPFVNTPGFRPEIYAYGLRNVWKFSFDSVTGQLWAADVGQNAVEEINLVTAGGNYGWNNLEGDECFPSGSSCDPTGTALPVWTYRHTQGDRSITGGYVYRGSQLPQLAGHYIYGDYVSGRIWALHLTPTDTTNTFLLNAGGFLPSFAVDTAGEVYVVRLTGNTGRLLRLRGPVTDLREQTTQLSARLYPNPARNWVEIACVLPTATALHVRGYDLRGRRVGTEVVHTLGSGAHTLPLDVSTWAPGVYVIELQTADAARRLRLVVH